MCERECFMFKGKKSKRVSERTLIRKFSPNLWSFLERSLIWKRSFVFKVSGSVTRVGNLLKFGQLFKACGNKNFAQSSTFLGNFCKVVKIFNFSIKIIFGQLSQTFGDFLLVTLVSGDISTLTVQLVDWSTDATRYCLLIGRKASEHFRILILLLNSVSHLSDFLESTMLMEPHPSQRHAGHTTIIGWGASYKASRIVTYESIVVNISNLLVCTIVGS